MQKQHSPLPWRIEKGEILDSNNTKINSMCKTRSEVEKDMQFAVMAVNSHHQLYSLVRAWLYTDPYGTHSESCREIISKIEGK